MKNNKGMALVMVLSISLFLMVLGTSYINTVTSVSPTNPKKLNQLQAGYFAQGIQKLALLKFKLFPADFYHAYRYNVEITKVPKNPAVTKLDPSPFKEFVGKKSSILQGKTDEDFTSIATPSAITKYSTTYTVSSSKKFDKDILDIETEVSINEFTQKYKVSLDIERVLIP